MNSRASRRVSVALVTLAIVASFSIAFLVTLLGG